MQACCSLGPACDYGAQCQASGLCSWPIEQEFESCVLPKVGAPSIEAGFCGAGLTCELPEPGAAQGTCVACGGVGEACCAGYTYFCDSGLSCSMDQLVCLPA